MDTSAHLDILTADVTALLRRAGHELTPAEVGDILWEAGVGDLAEDLAVARSIIRAADGFHPVASFFVQGTAERELILRVLHHGGAEPATSHRG